mmetsp:Transcript_37621/g.91445  ORF Transcript_37621/g.91445 Transcript_37621/m.91445 type:complete len:362 (-) Transcript_37621:3128-4213(-)
MNDDRNPQTSDGMGDDDQNISNNNKDSFPAPISIPFDHNNQNRTAVNFVFQTAVVLIAEAVTTTNNYTMAFSLPSRILRGCFLLAFFFLCSSLVLVSSSWSGSSSFGATSSNFVLVTASTVAATPTTKKKKHHHQPKEQEQHHHNRPKQVLLDETFTSSLSPTESRDYMLKRRNWLQVVPNCEEGSITEEKEGPEDLECRTDEQQQQQQQDDLRRVRGSWTIKTNNGDDIICSDTVFSDDRRLPERFIGSGGGGGGGEHESKDDHSSREDGCYLRYNILVNMHKDGVSFTFDIEYDIRPRSVRRFVHSFQPIGWKSKMVSPLIKSGLVELMQEENQRLTKAMNSLPHHDLTNARILHSSKS